MEQKIIELLKQNSLMADNGTWLVGNVVSESDFPYVAKQIVKLLAAPDVMPSLPLDVIDFIGRCELYRENGKWYHHAEGLFSNDDEGLLKYIIELNQKATDDGNGA